MKAIIYNKKNYHDETCGFELYKKVIGMTNCGAKAYGQIGKTPLCQEHFDYGAAMQGEIAETEHEIVRRSTKTHSNR